VGFRCPFPGVVKKISDWPTSRLWWPFRTVDGANAPPKKRQDRRINMEGTVQVSFAKHTVSDYGNWTALTEKSAEAASR